MKNKSNADQLLQGFQFKTRRSFLIQQFEDILKRQRGITLGAKFFINRISCGLLCKSDDYRLINKAAQLVSKDLDVFMILSKLQEVDKLKNVIFDHHQQTLFNFFPKPQIMDINEFASRELLLDNLSKKGSIASTLQKQKKVAANKIKVQGRTAFNVLRAANRFKRGLFKQRDKYGDVNAYKKLYEAYEQIMEHQSPQVQNQEVNVRLIKQLGQEMEDIFFTSKIVRFLDDKNDNNETSKNLMKSEMFIESSSQKDTLKLIAYQNQSLAQNLSGNQKQKLLPLNHNQKDQDDQIDFDIDEELEVESEENEQVKDIPHQFEVVQQNHANREAANINIINHQEVSIEIELPEEEGGHTQKIRQHTHRKMIESSPQLSS